MFTLECVPMQEDKLAQQQVKINALEKALQGLADSETNTDALTGDADVLRQREDNWTAYIETLEGNVRDLRADRKSFKVLCCCML